jgi:cytochrome c oxidase cbb3-type subunit III
MSATMNLLVIGLTLVNIVACVWLMWWTAKRRPGELKTTGHVWDGDLEEYNNPLPRWWLWLFVLTIVFGLVYLVLYPGLGSFGGVQDWSSSSQYQAEVERQNARVAELFAPFESMSLEALARDASAMSAAKNLFANNCSTCHGSDARGARGFPNLTDHDWLWGGAPETIYQTIAHGRTGVMPALGAALGEEATAQVAAYVMSLSGRAAPADQVAAGKVQFETLCAACHGVDGKGNPAVGAPNLTDEVWLYGGQPETVLETINVGRTNQMPAHLDLLGETKVRLLAAYVLRISGSVGDDSHSERTDEESSDDGGS